MLIHLFLALAIVGMLLVGTLQAASQEDEVRAAVSFYASFDEAPRGDLGQGDLDLWTRSEHETEKGKHVFAKGYDAKLVRVARDKGVQGGALELTGDLPRNGILYYPAAGKLAYQRGGWSGAFSIWVKPSPQTPFCDIVYITQKRWNNGGIWFDFHHDKQRDLRVGTFPAVPDGQPEPKETDANIPMLRIARDAMRVDEWNHVVMTWEQLDTGRKDGVSRIYIDAKLVGDIKDRDLAMNWDLEQTRIFIAFKYLGLLDEFAMFKRSLSESEVALLQKQPALLAPLKK